jgi:acyl-CoA thioester hydrolase/bile acid acetyltransferase-like protein
MKKKTLLLLLLACLIGGMMTTAAGRKAASTIRVAPDRALVDEVVSVSISGLSQGQAATVKVTLNDNHGVAWRSEAEFIADRKGVVDLSKHAPSPISGWMVCLSDWSKFRGPSFGAGDSR